MEVRWLLVSFYDTFSFISRERIELECYATTQTVLFFNLYNQIVKVFVGRPTARTYVRPHVCPYIRQFVRNVFSNARKRVVSTSGIEDGERRGKEWQGKG